MPRLSPLISIVFMAVALLFVPDCVAVGQPGDGATVKSEAGVRLQVYKKWIGASGEEADVEIHLACDSPVEFEPLQINRDRADGWEIPGVPAEGIFCTVREVERETFVADTSDCRELLVVPGQDVECTLVNTKVVKRIDMLNRYGLFMLIFVMLGAGLAAVKRYGPV